MTTKHKPYQTYTKEFKLEALRLMESSGRPSSEVARELGRSWMQGQGADHIRGAPLAPARALTRFATTEYWRPVPAEGIRWCRRREARCGRFWGGTSAIGTPLVGPTAPGSAGRLSARPVR